MLYLWLLYSFASAIESSKTDSEPGEHYFNEALFQGSSLQVIESKIPPSQCALR